MADLIPIPYGKRVIKFVNARGGMDFSAYVGRVCCKHVSSHEIPGAFALTDGLETSGWFSNEYINREFFFESRKPVIIIRQGKDNG